MTEVLLLRSGNPRRLTEPVWRGTVELCAAAGVPVLSTPPDPPGGPEDLLPPALHHPVPEDTAPEGVAALLAEYSPARVVHCADPDALVRRDAEAVLGYGRSRGRVREAERADAAFRTLLHKGLTRDLCDRLGIATAEGVWGPADDGWLREAAAEALERHSRVVVKDPEGWAGRGQHVATRPAELTEALDAAGGRPVVVEGYVDGEEISVEVVLRDGEGLVLGWAVKGGTEEGGHPLHRPRLVPAGPVPAGLADRSLRLCAAAGYDGMAEVEFAVGRDGVPRVLECNPRVSAISRSIAASNGCSSTELAVRAALTGIDELPRPARLETAERVLPHDLSAETLTALGAAPGVAWVHQVTDGWQPRVLLGGVAGEERVDEGVRRLAGLTGIDLAGPLELRRSTAARLAEVLAKPWEPPAAGGGHGRPSRRSGRGTS